MAVRVIKIRRYLLSRFWHYHRLAVLNFCVRDGNRCDHYDIVTGRSAARDETEPHLVGCGRMANRAHASDEKAEYSGQAFVH